MEKEKSQWGAQLFFNEQEGKEADSKTKTSTLRNRMLSVKWCNIYVPILYIHLAIIMHGSNDVIYICSYFVYTLSHYYAWVQWCNIYVPILYTYLTVKWCNIYRLQFPSLTPLEEKVRGNKGKENRRKQTGKLLYMYWL